MTRGIGWIGSVAAALLLTASPAMAGVSVSSLFLFGPNHASDEHREYLIDDIRTQIGQIDVGDSIRGLYNVNTLNNDSANVGGNTPVNEFTGLFQIYVTSKTEFAGPDGPIFRLTFGPDPDFEADWGAGAIVVMFEDDSNNFTADYLPNPAQSPPGDTNTSRSDGPNDDGTPGPGRTVPPSSADVSVGPYASEEAFIATATDGDRFWTIGFTSGTRTTIAGEDIMDPGPGEGYQAVLFGSDNILAAFLKLGSDAYGIFNLALNRLDNDIPETGDSVLLGKVTSGPPFPGPADFIASGTLRGVRDLDTAFESSGDLSISFNVIPEPASSIVWGLFGMITGAGALWRRRRMLALA
ncbi:MAG: hypothetical protein WD847_08175 [Pirellulales bacterium]